jgi:hypothetical protein
MAPDINAVACFRLYRAMARGTVKFDPISELERPPRTSKSHAQHSPCVSSNCHIRVAFWEDFQPLGRQYDGIGAPAGLCALSNGNDGACDLASTRPECLGSGTAPASCVACTCSRGTGLLHLLLILVRLVPIPFVVGFRPPIVVLDGLFDGSFSFLGSSGSRRPTRPTNRLMALMGQMRKSSPFRIDGACGHSIAIPAASLQRM